MATDFDPSALCATVADAAPNLVVTFPLFCMAGILEMGVFAPFMVMVADLVPMYRL